ncbi:MAG TPA: winged helix-turn-helix domain-containing protein [Sphingomicrobium sp.]
MATALSGGGRRIDLTGIADFDVGSARVRPALLEIRSGAEVHSVEPRVMQMLVALYRARGGPIAREELIELCWGGLAVSDDAINQCVSKLRRAVSSLTDVQVISVPRVGYRLTGVVPAAEPPTIAVLPFVNIGGNPDQDYFVEGMVDEIVAALTRVRTLLVISSESSSALKGKDWDERQAAARMGVRYVLKGSVRRSTTQVRLALKVVDTSRGVQIWSENFDFELKDVFELQDRIALEVAAVIEPSVHEAEVRRIARQPVENLGCYDLYLRAAPLRATCRKAEVAQALELLDRALLLDPDFAPALAQAAGCHSQFYENGWSDDQTWHRTQGLVLADRAIMYGADDAVVLAQVANALMDLEGNVARATALAERAIAINPGCARAWFIAGLARLLDHDGDAAVEYLETAARLDPISSLNDVIRAHIGVGRFLRGDYRGALATILPTSHRTARIHLTLAAIYGYLGMVPESQAEMKMFESRSPLPAEDLITIGIMREESRVLLLDGINRARSSAV